MKSFTNFAATAALSLIALGTASASPLNFYASGGFTSGNVNGGIVSTAAPAFGDTYPNNRVSFTNGTDTVDITYADLATATSPANVNSPTNIGYGIFDIDNHGGTGSVTIGAFTFALVVHDLTDGGTATFIGTTGGGSIGPNSSTVSVSWAPANPTGIQLGSNVFSVFSPTPLVPPSTTAGQTTIQGQVTSTVPEPASMLLMGAGLLGLGFVSKRKLANKA